MAVWLLNTIEVNGGFLSGLSLSLPPGLTCVIGPRGSGKSTLAEAIRYALGNTRAGVRSARDLIEKNLSNAVITIRTKAEADGAGYVIRRSGREAPILTNLAGESVAGVDLERGSFLPLDAYSNNEIEEIADASLGDKRRELLDDLRGEAFARIQVAIADRQRALEANRDAIRLATSTTAGLRERVEELAEAPAKLAALPAGPAGEGEGDLARLAKQVLTNGREIQTLEQLARLADEYRRETEKLASACETGAALSADESANCELLAEIEGEAFDRFRTAALHLTQAGVELAAVPELIARHRPRLAERHARQQAEYAGLQEKNLVAGQAVQERAAAEQAVMQLRELEGQLKEEEANLARLLDERKHLRGAYLLERERVSTLRSEVAEELQKEAGQKVRVRVLRNADSHAYQQLLASGLQVARLRNHEDIVSALMRLRPEDLAQLIHDNDADEFEAQTGLGKERARKILEAFRDKIDPMDLETVPIEDRVCIELNVASQAEPHFKDAADLSRGQKCTALLPLLLARRDAPLVIDQPEDNLDNHFIFETVVETVRRLKTRRQLIFVTHNANIPVLGEADQIVVLDSDGRKGFVKKCGGVDDCRDEIIDLLEGGRKAFELRRQRYAAK